MKRLLAVCLGLVLLASSALAEQCGKDRKQWRAWQKAGEPYSIAVCDGTDPQQLYETAKAALAQKPVNRFAWPAQLAGVARAAFEAGHNAEAQAYAEQALATAAESFYINAKPMSFEGWAYGDATVEANTVLGHLALLRGDVPAAEKYLLLSGQIQPGGTTFWGPHMTLALELLRRHRQDAVLQFLDECSRSWPKECPNCSFEKWAATIRSGKIPDFGANLIYSLYPAYYVSSR